MPYVGNTCRQTIIFFFNPHVIEKYIFNGSVFYVLLEHYERGPVSQQLTQAFRHTQTITETPFFSLSPFFFKSWFNSSSVNLGHDTNAGSVEVA